MTTLSQSSISPFVLSLVIASCAGPDGPSAQQSADDSESRSDRDDSFGDELPDPGPEVDPELYTIEHDGRQRSFLLHIPESVDESTPPMALVLNFHGYTGSAASQREMTRLDELADEEGFVAVHPDGHGWARSWNAGDCCGVSARDELDDVALARAIVDHVATLASIDHSRVYAMGFSNGAFMSHRLACEASDLFAAIAPVSGVLGIAPEQCTPARPVPVLHTHGTADSTVPYEGGGQLEFRSVAETVSHWVEINGCSEELTEVTLNDVTTCEIYQGCEGSAEVQLCTIREGEHDWTGGLDLTRYAWEFLKRFSIS